MSLRQHSTTIQVDEFPVTDVMAPHPTIVIPTADAAPIETTGSSDEPMNVRARGSAKLIMGALITLLVSAWAGIIPFVGPTFGFSADGTSSWTWNHAHALGALAPGAVAVLACLLVLRSARMSHGFASFLALRTWGFVLFLCGAWLTVMPVAWPVLVGPYFHAASPTMTLAYWMGYSSGPGLLLAGFGTFVIGRSRCYRMTAR